MTPWEQNPGWVEGDLYIDFSQARQAWKLDGPKHGLSHCMHSVDFVVEWENQLWLIEIKDPDNGHIPDQHKAKQRRHFKQQLLSHHLINKHLFPKLRDSLIYLSLNKGIADKPMKYIALIGLSTLQPAELGGLTQALWDHEWVKGPKAGWQKSFDVHCLSVGQWNRLLKQCPITRISCS